MRIQHSAGSARRHYIGVAALSLLVAVHPAIVTAQEPVTDPRDTTHSQKQAPFFTVKDLVLAGGFVGATVLMFPLDKRAAAALLDSGTQTNRLFKHASIDV